MLGIVVAQADGMTWSAEKAREILDRSIGRPLAVRGSTKGRDPLRELADLVGSEKAVLDSARRSGLVPGVQIPWKWLLTVGGVFLLLAAITAVLTADLAAALGVPALVVAAVAGAKRDGPGDQEG